MYTLASTTAIRHEKQCIGIAIQKWDVTELIIFNHIIRVRHESPVYVGGVSYAST